MATFTACIEALVGAARSLAFLWRHASSAGKYVMAGTVKSGTKIVPTPMTTAEKDAFTVQ
jgi:hypothetical protein